MLSILLSCSALLPRLAPTSVRLARSPVPSMVTSDDDVAGAQLVWFTGAADLRVKDHGGLLVAAANCEDNAAVVPVFILDPVVHLQRPPYLVRRLQRALTSLEAELQVRHGCPLIVRSGPALDVLPQVARECGATACHVISDDVCDGSRAMMVAGCAALTDAGIEICRWDAGLRATPFVREPTALPDSFPEYVAGIEYLPLQAPLSDEVEDGELPVLLTPLPTEGVPSVAALLEAAEAATPPALRDAWASAAAASTTPPYESSVLSWCEEAAARKALNDYVRDGRAAFADAALADAVGGASASLHAAAAQRLVEGGVRPSDGLALREAAVRAFSPALALGVLSTREVLESARRASASALSPADQPWWGRSSEGALSDVVEWREWFELLAKKSLARQQEGAPATSGGGKAQGGDPRASGRVGYWRWGGAHLVRYESWPAGAEYDGKAPALLLVHGFAASAEQWERLVHSLRAQADAAMLPPIYAIDLLGFGHSEKPGLSYTQYVWESQLVDFALEVMGAQPLVLVGNSIGGGLAAGAAATLGPLVRGVVLCNTAGVLEEPDEYEQPAPSCREATLARAIKPYSPVPLVGQPALDLFGEAVIGAIFPQIPTRLADIYADRAENADAAVVFAIQQGASSPGSANVIGSGQKLAANRPLNEVLNAAHGFGGPVLVAQGKNDRVSGPARAQSRAQLFKRLRPGVTVAELDAGHCPQDEVPEAVAAAMLAWMPEATAWEP